MYFNYIYSNMVLTIIILIELIERDSLLLAPKWATLRPEQLKPAQFIELTIDLYGLKGSTTSTAALNNNNSTTTGSSMKVTNTSSDNNKQSNKLETSHLVDSIVATNLESSRTSSTTNTFSSTTTGVDKTQYLSDSIWRKTLRF